MTDPFAPPDWVVQIARRTAKVERRVEIADGLLDAIEQRDTDFEGPYCGCLEDACTDCFPPAPQIVTPPLTHSPRIAAQSR